MEKNLVADRAWLTKSEYMRGMALSQLAPGPLAAQLAMYIGYTKQGFIGATAVGLVFVLGRRAITDAPTAAIAIGTLGVPILFRIPEPIVVVIAGLAGVLIYKSASSSKVLLLLSQGILGEDDGLRYKRASREKTSYHMIVREHGDEKT